MEDMAIILIFAAGLLAMLVELFLPGAIIGTSGFLAAVGSIVFAFVKGQHVLGGVLILVLLAFIPLFFVLWKHVLGRFMALTDSETGYASGTLVNDSLLGKEGVAESSLRPSGIATIEDRRYDVVTRGEMLTKGDRIRIIDVTGNRIVVRKV